MLARGPAAPRDRRGHRPERRARRDRPGAARGVRPPLGGDPRGRAGHRQDAPAARRSRARLGERVHLRRDHGRRGDPRAVPRRAEPVRRRAPSATPPRGRRPRRAVRRVVEAISGRDERGFETLSPDAKLLRAFDLAGVAIAALAGIRPLALLIDDVQWADDDTLRLLRYVVRSDADRPIFLFLTIRPDEFASVTEAVNFVADMERMGLVRRLRPGRFSSVETAELLKRVLGGPVEAASAAAMHAQSEGVPFIVEELARTHREAGTLQQIDGEWRLGRNAARLVPSAVRTLIDRRAARLPARTRAALGDAAILGRSFSLRDLRAIRARLGDGVIASDAGTDDQAANAVPARPVDATADGDGADPLADDLAPAVRAGLLLAQAQGEPADYTFTHEQVRQFAANQLSAARRRQVHAAVVDLLLDGGDPAPAGLPMLAQHALAAGDTRPRRALLDRCGDGRPRLQRPGRGAPARRAGAPGRVDAGRPAGPPRDSRRRVRRPAPDERAARWPDRAGGPRRGDARSGHRARRTAAARVGAADEP